MIKYHSLDDQRYKVKHSNIPNETTWLFWAKNIELGSRRWDWKFGEKHFQFHRRDPNTGTNVCTFYPHGIYRYKMLRIVTWFHLELLNAWPYSVDRRDYGIWSLSDLTDFWFLMKWNINGKYQRAKSKFTKVFFNSWNRLKWHFQRFDSFLDVRPNEYKNCTIENFDRIYRENKKWRLGTNMASRIPTVKLKIPGKSMGNAGYRTSVTFKL